MATGANGTVVGDAFYWLKNDGTIWGAGTSMPGLGNSESGETNVPWTPWTSTPYTPTQMPTSKTGADVVEIAPTNRSLAWRRSSGPILLWHGDPSSAEKPRSAHRPPLRGY